MLLVLGASLPLLASTLFDAWVRLFLDRGQTVLTWRHYGASLSPAVLLVFGMVICIRGVWRSALPGVGTVLGLVGLVLAVALLNHGL
jgi:hypothetical protein